MADQDRRVGLLKAVGGSPRLIAGVLLAEYVLVALVAASPARAAEPPAGATVASAPRDVTIPALPLFWFSRRATSSTFVAPPLLFGHHSDEGGSTTTLFPLYWRLHDNERDATTTLLFPVAALHKHRGAAGAYVLDGDRVRAGLR